MKTKLVYVLTCAPDATYIEQALMAVWSARHWNKSAHIVLMVDDRTDALLTDKRGEILNYISEKIVVPFEEETLTPMYRSRWIKTKARQLIKGDFLFIDCDTICCHSLAEVDNFSNTIGAVWDSHVSLTEDVSFETTRIQVLPIGLDLSDEICYYSSGVIYVKDTPETYRFYELWHTIWLQGTESNNLSVDQPSLAKANVEMNHIITSIPDVYNCVVYTENTFIPQAAILHITAYRNPSFLFAKEFLLYIREHGLDDDIKEWILKPVQTWLPFDYHVLHSTCSERLHWIYQIRRVTKYMRDILFYIPDGWFRMNSHFKVVVYKLFENHFYLLGACAWMLGERIHVLLHKNSIKDNICKK